MRNARPRGPEARFDEERNAGAALYALHVMANHSSAAHRPPCSGLVSKPIHKPLKATGTSGDFSG
jgi:hypothetical protein